jgi:hypothetical protein
MPAPVTLAPLPDAAPRADALYEQLRRHAAVRTDRLFAWLLALEWLAVIAVAVWFTPYTWIGATKYVHAHVWAALLGGGAVLSLPIFLIRHRARPSPGMSSPSHRCSLGRCSST